jgi:hypothetical protein
MYEMMRPTLRQEMSCTGYQRISLINSAHEIYSSVIN